MVRKAQVCLLAGFAAGTVVPIDGIPCTRTDPLHGVFHHTPKYSPAVDLLSAAT